MDKQVYNEILKALRNKRKTIKKDMGSNANVQRLATQLNRTPAQIEADIEQLADDYLQFFSIIATHDYQVSFDKKACHIGLDPIKLNLIHQDDLVIGQTLITFVQWCSYDECEDAFMKIMPQVIKARNRATQGNE